MRCSVTNYTRTYTLSLHDALPISELVVEVLSPDGANERRDREVKLKLYSRRGVLEYWIVDWRTQQIPSTRMKPSRW